LDIISPALSWSHSACHARGTPAEADQFVAEAEKRLLELNIKYARADWVNARRIINGTDKANLIADYARRYYGAISYTT